MVILSGMELGLFPHSRSMNSESALEEERRLCYVGMTRARKRLILTWAKYRRRFGGGEQERSTPSWFLSEIPADLIVDLGQRDEPGEVNLMSERHDVRQAARRNTFTGKTYNSVENISQFFGERGMPFNAANKPFVAPQQPPAPMAPIAAAPGTGQAGAAGRSAGSPGRARRNDGGASQVRHRDGGAPRRGRRRC